MQVLVISDIHDNFHNLQIALDYAAQNHMTHGFALGDLINPGILWNIGRSNMTWDVVLGNNDGDKFNLVNATKEFPNINLGDVYLEIERDNKKLFLTHYDKIGEIGAKSGDYDAVFCGHNHHFTMKHHGNTLLANPGELSGHMFGQSTFGIWDSQKNTFTGIKLHGNWIDVKKWKRSEKPVFTDVTFEAFTSGE